MRRGAIQAFWMLVVMKVARSNTTSVPFDPFLHTSNAALLNHSCSQAVSATA